MSRFLRVTCVLGLLLLFAGAASANPYIQTATGSATCTSYTLTVTGQSFPPQDSTPGTVTINYELVFTPQTGSPINVTGSMSTTTTGTSWDFSVTTTQPIGPLTQPYTITGTATLVSGYVPTAWDTKPIIFTPDTVSCAPPPPMTGCWLTTGGVKFSPIAGYLLADRHPYDSFGGNVYPGCSPTAGDGGQWNHIAHSAKLHFQAWTIEVVRCGNVGDIPDGSTSPVTPYNFIEFKGTGTLKGISGNKADFGEVQFFARVEDRSEPGNENSSAGSYIDTYFLNVWKASDPGVSLLLFDLDNNPMTVDPLTITGGNLQLHISSCPVP